MRVLLDFLPIAIFFGVYHYEGIYTATAVLMAATVVQMALIRRMDGQLQLMHKITLTLVLMFGTLTLALHDERFIKWKPTVLYAAMALALAIALWCLRKNFLKLMLGNQLSLPDAVWLRLNVAWIAYCLFMSSANAYVALLYSTEAWVNFKLWGYVFPLLFLVGQGLYVARHLQPTDGKE